MKILVWQDEAVKYIANNIDKIKIKGSLIIDDSELPNRDFRNAWTLKDGKVIIDINKAKEIQKDNIRIDRAEKLKELDYQFMLALEQSKDYSDITKQKQVLRDLPQKVDACKTIDEIKKIEV